mmetsp:Transcript_23202/g.77902  ORF Transcript_23202/g.77902 Transcript_23202/m.77902 type:complete len:219 (-) Transcript_23202:402-1058(-)
MPGLGPLPAAHLRGRAQLCARPTGSAPPSRATTRPPTPSTREGGPMLRAGETAPRGASSAAQCLLCAPAPCSADRHKNPGHVLRRPAAPPAQPPHSTVSSWSAAASSSKAESFACSSSVMVSAVSATWATASMPALAARYRLSNSLSSTCFAARRLRAWCWCAIMSATLPSSSTTISARFSRRAAAPSMAACLRSSARRASSATRSFSMSSLLLSERW